MASEKYSNLGKTTLNTSINNSTTTVIVDSATAFPTTGQFRIRIEDEILLVTSVSSNTFTVSTRGTIDGTSAASHTSGVAVQEVVTNGSLNQILADNWMYGAAASRPSAERAGRIYQCTDSLVRFRDNGSSWDTFYRGRKLTTPIYSDFTETDGGNAATVTQVTNAHTFMRVNASATGDRICAFMKNVPSAPYTVTSIFIPLLSPQTYTYAGMIMSDGTKYVQYGYLAHNLGIIPLHNLWTAKLSNITTFDANYFIYPLPLLANPMTLRIKDDNTNRIMSYSNDGYNFVDIFSVGRTDYLTPTKIGVFIGTSSATAANGVNNIGAMTWLSWLEQ